MSIGRRSFLLTLPALSSARGTFFRLRRAALPVGGIHHATLAVSDVGRSLEFYQTLFGAPVQGRSGSSVFLRLGDGPRFLALEPTEGAPPRIVEFGLEVEELQEARVAEALGARAAGTTLRSEGPTLLMTDPAGLRSRLVLPSWCGTDLCRAEPAPAASPLALRDLGHLTISVPEPDRAIAFYRETFDLDVQTLQATVPALGVGLGVHFLMFIPGRQARVHHVCFAVEGFDVEGIRSALEEHGLRPRADGAPPRPLQHWVTMRMPDRGGAPGGTPELYFSDPDGLTVQLQDVRYCGGGGSLGDEC